MGICEHMLITDNIILQITNIKKAAKQNNVNNCPQCILCKSTYNVFVGLENNLALCKVHLHLSPRYDRNHFLMYNNDADTLYCKTCDVCNIIPECLIKKKKQVNDKNVWRLKKIEDFGGSTGISSLLQIIINYPRIRDYYMGFHHTLIDCPINDCPDCFYKKIIAKIYSNDPVDLSNTIYHILQKSTKYSSFSLFNLKYIYQILIDVYHNDQQPKNNCDCIMHKTFYGALTITKKCMQCGIITQEINKFNYINSNTDKRILTVVNEFLNPNPFVNLVHCSNCQSNSPTHISRSVSSYPNMLCIIYSSTTSLNTIERATRVVDRSISVNGRMYNLCAFAIKKKLNPCIFSAFIILNNDWYEFRSDRINPNVNITYDISKADMLFYELA